MIQIFAILYTISTIGFIIAGLPQIIQVLRTKMVEGISLQTYDLWFVMQLVSTPYIAQSGDLLWQSANIMWIVYYGLMILLIEHYRYPHYVRVLVDKFVQVLRLIPVPARTKN